MPDPRRPIPTACRARPSRRATTSTLEPDLGRRHFAGTCSPRIDVTEPTDAHRAQRHRARHHDRRGSCPTTGAPVEAEPHRARRGRPSGPPCTSPTRSPPATRCLHTEFTGHPQRQAARLLPQHLHRRPTASSRSSPPPSSRPPTPAGPSRAGTSPTSRPCSASPSWSTPTWPPSPTRPRSAARPASDGKHVVHLRRHDDDVDLPGGLHRRARSTSPTRSTSTAPRCGSCTRGARATSPPTPSRWARSACDFFADYFGMPYPGDKLDLVAVPDFAFGAMENLGLRHLPRGAAAGRPDRGRPSPSCRTSPTSSPTSWRTCGSATSSR